MKINMQNLTSALFIAATFGIGQAQDHGQELRVRDIKAQQPPETILASSACQQTRSSPGHSLIQRTEIDPKTLVKNLGTLLQRSDEVVLVGIRFADALALSPSGETAVSYFDVKVMRSWKGPHNIGDTLTFGIPAGAVYCGPSGAFRSVFSTMTGTSEWKGNFFGPYVLFLKHPNGNDPRMVQGLVPASGAGLQGMFPIRLPVHSEAYRQCNGALEGSVPWCDSYLETSQDPVIVPYVRDPLAKNYDGMPVSEFLREVRIVAAAQGLAEKSTVR